MKMYLWIWIKLFFFIHISAQIIFHNLIFCQDFIVSRARGKSGPLFSFDVREDVRLVNDATIEKVI